MKPYRIAVLPGDGIGPEIMQASLAVLRAVESPDLSFEFSEQPFGAGHFRREQRDCCRQWSRP